MAIADHWNLPEPLRDVIAYHHNPMNKPDSDLVSIIHVSNIVSKIVMKIIPADNGSEFDQDLLEKIGYTRGQLHDLANELEPEITSMTAHATAIITG